MSGQRRGQQRDPLADVLQTTLALAHFAAFALLGITANDQLAENHPVAAAAPDVLLTSD